MRKCIHWMMFFAVTGMFCGCINVQVKRETLKKYLPVEPDDVVVYSSSGEVQGDYETVALLHVEDKRVRENRDRILKHIRIKAGALGANAVIVGKMNAPVVPGEFHDDAFQSDDYAPHNDLPQAVIDEDPGKQDAWMDVLAIFIKNK